MSRSQVGQVILGSAALEHPMTRTLNVNSNTCFQLSMFKDVMREYRRLDDSVTMRMNRNGALFREAARSGYRSSSGPSSAGDDSEACLYFWRQLVANWKSRAEIIDYCIRVVDQQLEQKEGTLRQVIDDGTPSTQPALFKPGSTDAKPWQGPTNEFYRPVAHDQEKPPQGELDSQQQYELERRQRERENDARIALWEERVKKDQITNELTVEAIVRRRSYEAFRSRCKFFEPSPEDKDARVWWDRVANSRSSRT